MRHDVTAILSFVVPAAAACIFVFVVHSIGMAMALLLLATPAMIVALRFVRMARHHEAAVQVLRAGSDQADALGIPIRTGEFCGSAFVGGLRHPEIFIDREVLSSLTDAERLAVILHEHHHRLRRDPLRIALASLARPLLSTFRHGRTWLTRTEAQREIRADAYALAHGASAPAIASALQRVQPAAVGLAGFGAVIDLRIAALVGESPEPPRPIMRWAAGAGLLAGLVLCVGAFHAAWLFCCP